MRGFTINPPVFFGSLAVVLGFALIGVVIPDQAEEFFSTLQSTILDRFGWFYILAVAGFVVIVLLLGLTRFGRLKLGPDDARPDFPFMSWVAMLFAAVAGTRRATGYSVSLACTGTCMWTATLLYGGISTLCLHADGSR